MGTTAAPHPALRSSKIFVTFAKEGIHKYPAALTDPALATGDEYDYFNKESK